MSIFNTLSAVLFLSCVVVGMIAIVVQVVLALIPRANELDVDVDVCPICSINVLPNDQVYCCEDCACTQDEWSSLVEENEEYESTLAAVHAQCVAEQKLIDEVNSRNSVIGEQRSVTASPIMYAPYGSRVELGSPEWEYDEAMSFALINGYAFLIFDGVETCVKEYHESILAEAFQTIS